MCLHLSCQLSSLAILLSIHLPIGVSSPIPGQIDQLASRNSSVVNGAVVSDTLHFRPHIRAIETCLSIFALLLVAVTYSFFINYATFMGHNGKIPSKPTEKLMSSMLEILQAENKSQIILLDPPERKTPSDVEEKNGGAHTAAHDSESISSHDSESISPYDSESISPHDSESIPPHDSESISHHSLWTIHGSQASKNTIQLAIWQWVSLWLMVIMVVNTVMYNGFTSGDQNSDGWPRIAVVLIYAVFYVCHSIYMFISVFGAYTVVVRSACWTLLGHAGFRIKGKGKGKGKGDSDSNDVPEIWEIDRSIGSSTVIPRILFPDGQANGGTNEDDRKKKHRESIVKIHAKQEKEEAEVEKVTKAALDHILVNATILLSISVATSFSTWTPRQQSDSTSTQLGSLALLGSASTALGALLGSALQASHMRHHAEQILRMKEIIINGKAKQFLEGKLEGTKMVGFTRGRDFKVKLDRRWIWPYHLLRALRPHQIIFGLFLGPAFVLIPSWGELHGRSDKPSKLNLDTTKKRYVLTRQPKSDKYELVDAVTVTGADEYRCSE